MEECRICGNEGVVEAACSRCTLRMCKKCSTQWPFKSCFFCSPPKDPKNRVGLADAFFAARRLRVDLSLLPLSSLRQGMEVELEHGFVNASASSPASVRARAADRVTNITDNDCLATAKIALAHFAEGLNYYLYLEQVEKQLEKERGPATAFVDVFEK